MTAVPSLQTIQACLQRAVTIKETAERLRAEGDEWFAVCYFYTAYHTVKAALLEDPVFDDLNRLSRINRFLIMEDRYATSHHGRVLREGGRRMGVNDIVTALYPAISVEYVRLHMASVDVRYKSGLGAIAAQSVVADYDAVISAYQSAELKAP